MVLRVTRQDVEIATTTSGALRVTRQMVEVLTKAETGTSVSASQNLIFTQKANLAEFPVSQNLVFGQTIDVIGPLDKSESQNLVFSDSASTTQGYARTVAHALGFSHSVKVTPTYEYATQNLVFTDSSSVPGERFVTQSVSFSDQAWSEDALFIQPLIFGQNAGAGHTFPGGIESSASDNLIFTDTAWKTLVLVGATDLSASDGLAFTQFAGFPIDVAGGPQVLTFTQVLQRDWIIWNEHTLIFEQDDAGYVVDRNLSAASNIIFKHAFMFENLAGSTCYYDPILVQGSDPDAPTAPTAAKPTFTYYDNVLLYYPTDTPTMSVQLRAPNMGDRDRLQNLRVQRESRGGTLQVFADPTWPKVQTLVLSFTQIKESEATDLQDFFLNTLGLTVGLRDWEGNVWHGVVVNPDEPLVRSRRDLFDITFEFDGEKQ